MPSSNNTIVTNASPETPTSALTADSLERYRKYNAPFLALSSLAAFSSLIYTIRRRTKVTPPSVSAILNSPMRDPRLTAYMFAGRAFGTATLLSFSGAALGVGLTAWTLGVSNFKEFSIRLRDIVHEQFPGLRRAHDTEELDDATTEFLSEVRREINGDQVSESEATKMVRERMKAAWGSREKLNRA